VPLPRRTPVVTLVLALAAGPPLAAQGLTVFHSERPRVEHWDWFDDGGATGSLGYVRPELAVP
jgi:hypothetical protein